MTRGPRSSPSELGRTLPAGIIRGMRIHLRDRDRNWVGRLEVDPDARPVRARVEAAPGDEPESGREVFLQWDSALDDAGHLRRCVACGGQDLFHEKAFPVITAVVVVLAFVGAFAGAFGFADRPAVLAILAAILVVDVGILMLSKRQLVCYDCHTAYPGEPIARYHRPWDRAMAERHPRRAAAERPAESAPDEAREPAPVRS